ncbi:hypothetical protein BDK51DRAFT_45059 [Blyttiomyces helicus]|uniref:Uncharacterized protein n=1 Tax=Blyttiomyces helicus TaxID=388810 RepID=A0A4P9W3E9_9FUNG|nr:hypothetical protein BDK51DRAFT_45059 [Blyttiomyces helicus]|eukprot:RKO84646.1 hypothetical protein BDK51DRAFT_45059 [Blyttiomyces helicus]
MTDLDPYILATATDPSPPFPFPVPPSSQRTLDLLIVHTLNKLHTENETDHPSILAEVDAHVKAAATSKLVPSKDAARRWALAKAHVTGRWDAVKDAFRDELGVADLGGELRGGGERVETEGGDGIPSVLDEYILSIASLITKAEPNEPCLAPHLLLSRTPLASLSHSTIGSILEAAQVPTAFVAGGKDYFPELVAAFLKNPDGSSRNSRSSSSSSFTAVADSMTLAQIDAVMHLVPEMKTDITFQSARIARVLPANENDCRIGVAGFNRLRRIVEEIEGFFEADGRFAALVRARVLFTGLERTRAIDGVWDREVFLEYLTISKIASCTPSTEATDYDALLPAELFPKVASADDEELVVSFLEHFIRSNGAETVDTFVAHLGSAPATHSWRKRVKEIFVRARIMAGDDPEKLRISPTELDDIRNFTIIEFAPFCNPIHIDPLGTAPIKLTMTVKSIKTLIIQIFEINTFSFYRDHQEDPDEALLGLDVAGLVPDRICRIDGGADPLLMEERVVEIEDMVGRRGLYLVEVMGGGRRCRAVVRKGGFKYRERITVHGHELTILDETGSPIVDDCQIYLGGHVYEPTPESNTIIVPFTRTPSEADTLILLTHAGLTTPALLNHLPEAYTLKTTLTPLPDTLVRGKTASLLVRAVLELNGYPVSLENLDRVVCTLTLNAEVDAVQVVDGFKIGEGGEGIVNFVVPEGLKGVRVAIEARVWGETAGAWVNVAGKVGEVLCNR